MIGKNSPRHKALLKNARTAGIIKEAIKPARRLSDSHIRDGYLTHTVLFFGKSNNKPLLKPTGGRQPEMRAENTEKRTGPPVRSHAMPQKAHRGPGAVFLERATKE